MRQLQQGLKASVLFGAATVLGACALPPDSSGNPLPATASGDKPTVLRHDIAAFLEEAPPPAEPFSPGGTLHLETLLDEILARNASLEAMRRAWLASEARAPQVSALEDPQFSFMFAPRLIDRIGQGSETGPMGEMEELGFAYKPELSQALPWPGKRRLRAESADHDADARYHDAAELRERLLAEGKAAFFDLFFAERALEVNAANLGILDDLVANAHARYEAGTARRQEALQAEVDRDRLHHRAIELRRMKAVAAARINALLNRPPASPLPPPPESLALPHENWKADALQAEAFNHRPELQSLAARVESARSEVELAKKEFYPDFMVSAAFDAFWQQDDLRPMLGFGLNIPIQQERRRAALREAREREAAALARLREAASSVALQVEVALQRLFESLHGAGLYRTSLLPAAQENLEAALAGYESGELELPAVLMAQKARMDMELEAIRLQVDARERMAELERAVGAELNPENSAASPPEEETLR